MAPDDDLSDDDLFALVGTGDQVRIDVADGARLVLETAPREPVGLRTSLVRPPRMERVEVTGRTDRSVAVSA